MLNKLSKNETLNMMRSLSHGIKDKQMLVDELIVNIRTMNALFDSYADTIQKSLAGSSIDDIEFLCILLEFYEINKQYESDIIHLLQTIV